MAFLMHSAQLLILTIQILAGSRALALLITAIPKLQGYEPTAKKAAEWSAKAEADLKKTRATMAVGCVATTLTLLSAAYLLVTSITAGGEASKPRHLIIVAVNAAVVLGARNFMAGYWSSKLRVPLPGAGDFNEASRIALEAAVVMRWMLFIWGAAGVGGALLV